MATSVNSNEGYIKKEKQHLRRKAAAKSCFQGDTQINGIKGGVTSENPFLQEIKSKVNK